MTTAKPFLRRLLPIAVAAAAIWPDSGRAQSTSALDPEAMRLLRASADYIAGLKEFELKGSSSIEMIVASGQKLEFEHDIAVQIRRPNNMRAERDGELVRQTFVYDGKTLALDLPELGYYATAATPPTLDGMLDTARDQLDVIAPGADFVYSNSFERLSDKLSSASVIGEAYIGDVRCKHLAFRNPEVDWQLYVEEGATPLPRKFVVTSKKMPQSPSFSITVSKWDTAPKLNDAMFKFTPATGAIKVDFVRAQSAPQKAR